jgi:hypothetical protein
MVRSQDNVIRKTGKTVQEGTLLLTNRRLVFATGNSVQESDVKKILQDRNVFAIPLDQIANVSGNRGLLRPSLNVMWHDPPGDPSLTKTEFLQKYRPANIDDLRNAINEWGPLIERAATSDIGEEVQSEKPKIEVPKIDDDQLKSRVLEELGDKQWKGFFQIERDLDEKYGTSTDPDALESCLTKLVKEKLLEQDKHGEFFRRIPTGKK